MTDKFNIPRKDYQGLHQREVNHTLRLKKAGIRTADRSENRKITHGGISMYILTYRLMESIR